MEWWNGIVECVLQGERSLLLQFFFCFFFFFKKVTVEGLKTSVCNQGPEGPATVVDISSNLFELIWGGGGGQGESLASYLSSRELRSGAESCSPELPAG